MENLIRKTLDYIGYTEDDATYENLENAFLDFVSAGVFGNLTTEEAEEDIENGDITLKMMCYNLMKTR